LTIASEACESEPVMTTGGAGIANNKPDWYFWDVRYAQDDSEIVVRVTPNNNIAALGGVVFLSTEGPQGPRHVGEFSRAGEYMKDYFVYKDGDTFHLFYNVGNAGATQDWQEPGNEKAFGHATSKDLKTWEHHPRILEVVPGTWEGQVVSAPSIIKEGDTYYMFYTGFDDRVLGKQAIGMATSKDLFHWERHPGNPVYEAPPWTIRNESGWLDCRDAHIIKHGDEFLLYTMVTTDKMEGAISLASSTDLKTWKDLGPSLVAFQAPESPRVFEHKGTFYMFATSGHGKTLVKSKDPKSGKWEEVPFRWPAPGFWSGWEVVEDGDRTIFSAFEWKHHGNLIRFWEVDWDGESPAVRY
jgi:sucrose-6-phosphate hydrolase SacC (GH32 family)